jgi:hypothetical protein
LEGAISRVEGGGFAWPESEQRAYEEVAYQFLKPAPAS